LEARSENKTFQERRYEQLRRERALGRAALEGYERRRYDELTSGLAEALSGAVDTAYCFEMKDGHMVAEDGEVILDLLQRGLRKDIKLAATDNFYSFLPHRSKAELNNFRQIEAGARGEADANTWVEISTLTEELDNSPQNRDKLIKAAQKPYWGRTMIRVSHWDDEKLHIFTVSSDNLTAAESFDYSGDKSSVSIFKEATRRQLGYDFKAQDSLGMLAEPIELSINDHSWKDLARQIAAEADRIISERFGGRWRQGRPEQEAVDLQKYVESQGQVLTGLLNKEKKLAAESQDYDSYQAKFNKELFNCIALLEERLGTGRAEESIVDYDTAASSAGQLAAAEGRVYDMCGEVVSSTTINTAQQVGSESLIRLIGRPVECPFCDKKVVVPASDLRDGKLYCKDCDLGVDVCTGERFSKHDKSSRPRRSFIDELIEDSQEINRQEALKREQRKAKAA